MSVLETLVIGQMANGYRKLVRSRHRVSQEERTYCTRTDIHNKSCCKIAFNIAHQCFKQKTVCRDRFEKFLMKIQWFSMNCIVTVIIRKYFQIFIYDFGWKKTKLIKKSWKSLSSFIESLWIWIPFDLKVQQATATFIIVMQITFFSIIWQVLSYQRILNYEERQWVVKQAEN